MNAYTKAITLFESIATASKIDFIIRHSLSGKPVNIENIKQRDAVQEQCLWAIEQLQAAYEEEVRLQMITIKEKVF